MKSVNETLESHEKISHIVISDDAWTIENNLLTPTMKIKRDRIEEKYGDAVALATSSKVVWISDM